MNFKQLMDRYYNDPAFNKMVNVFHHLIEECKFTPSEIREAMFVAQYRFEVLSEPRHTLASENDRVRELIRAHAAESMAKTYLKGTK